jgi:hypothetical protein
VSGFAREIEELERAGWQALSGAGGADFYSDVMAEDGLMVFPGLVMDKAAALAAIRSVAPWTSFELRDIRVAEPGPDTAIVVYLARAERRGQPEYRATMSSVYARRGDHWLLVLHQQSSHLRQV